MLPSGNDASLCLAENFGARIMFTKRPGEVLKPRTEVPETDKEGYARERIASFVKEMNRVAAVLNLKNT